MCAYIFYLYAEGFINFRKSLTDADWINSVAVSDDDWANGMEQMGLKVKRHMQEQGFPRLNAMITE